MSRGGRNRLYVAGLVLAVALALGAAACTSKDTTYCDEQVPCPKAGDFCDLETKTCEPKRDAAVGDAAHDRQTDAGGHDDAGGEAAPQQDAQADAQHDAPPATDAGCEATHHQCGDYCYANDDPTHCGTSCTNCNVPTNGSATCNGTACDFTCNTGYWKNSSTCDVCNTTVHCGSSCIECTSAPSNGHPTCDGTACDFGCNSGYWKNGTACEACNTTAHCGAGCVQCPTPQHAQSISCDGTACGFTCEAGWWPDGAQCSACDNAGHCGQSCVQCTGMTPVCQGGQNGDCVCNATSCSGTTPICNGATGDCRPCTAHDECTTKICDDDGSCVADGDIIYLGVSACTDGGSGTSDYPFCTLTKAIDTAKAGTRHAIYVRTGTYPTTTEQVIDRRIIIVGAGVENSEFRQDTASTVLLHVKGSGSLSLTSVRLRGNSASHLLTCDTPSGGGPWVTVDRGDIAMGGAMGIFANSCTLTVTRSSIGLNHSYGIMANNSHTVLRQTKFTLNGYAGLVFAGGTFDVENCLITNNGSTSGTSTYGGVRISGLATGTENFRFVNNTVANNTAPSTASAAGLWGDTSMSAVWPWNSIIYGNLCGTTACQVYGQIQPWFSDVQGCAVPNSYANINGDPSFVNASILNFHLNPASPCVNKGDSGSWTPPTVDLEDYPRSGNPDMGCYEAH